MNTKTTVALLIMVALISVPSAMAFQDPYPMDGYIVDKAGNTLGGANITFTNQATGEVIYTDSDSTYGWYSTDAGNFPTDYADGQTITYMVNYSGTTYQNLSYSFVINTSIGSNTANITLDQAPSSPTAFTDLGMNLIDHTPTITWTKGSDADSGDTVTTYIYVSNTSTPTVEEGNNTGTTLDLGSNVSLSDGVTYYYRLRSYDGERWSDYTPADQFRMNSLPNVSNVQISPATAYNDTDLTGSGTYADAEGDAESGSTYKWFKNGVELAGQTTTTLSSDQFVSGDEIIFQYTPNDGYEAGIPVNSSVKTISYNTFNITLPISWSIIGWTNQTASTAHAVGELIGENCEYVTERNSTTGQYISHNMGGPEGVNTFMVERGWGYYVKTSAETQWERNIDVGAYNITLPFGWSIIGWTNQTASTAHAVGELIGGNCEYVTERNSTTGQYISHNMGGPEGVNTFMINAGQGYYVKVSADTLWERDS